MSGLSAQDEKTIDEVVGVVEAAATAAAPLAGPYAPEVIAAIAGAKALVSYVEQLGHGDAIREALDAQLAVGRQANDAALEAKHAGDADTTKPG